MAIRPGGSVTVVGVPGFEDTIELPVIAWALSEKRVTGSFMGSSNSHREFPRLLDLWRAGRLDLDSMVTTTRSLSEIPDAFDDLVAGHGLRTVIDLAK